MLVEKTQKVMLFFQDTGRSVEVICTEVEFSGSFRKMLILEQYREPQMAQLYRKYLASGPFTYIEALFAGMLEDQEKAGQIAFDFYGPILGFIVYMRGR